MNKKLLSVILSGVLMVISAGVFVSCEDYDDDISNLQTQINDLGSTLTALQSQVQAGKWITSVSSTTEGLTIVFSDGTQYTITNGKDGAPGTPGGSGNGTLVEVKDGYWYLNGEKTDYLALTKEDKVPVPYVNEEDGYWYFYNEEGEAVKSEYKALGATYAVKDANTGVWTLHVPDADGTMQNIDLPTAAAKITGLTFTGTNRNLVLYNTTWKFDANGTGVKAASWAGPKTLPKDGSFIYGSTNQLEIQVSPADVAKDIENYTLTNSKNVTVGLALTAEPYNDLLGANGERVTKATTNGNGLYTITVEPQVISKDDQTALGKLVGATFATDDNGGKANVGYALVADNVFRSAYEVTITLKVPALSDTDFNGLKMNVTKGLGTDAKDIELDNPASSDTPHKINGIKVGTTYTVEFNNEEGIYDSYFQFNDNEISSYDITYDNESRTFTVGKNPDIMSLQGKFTVDVYTIDIRGTVHKRTLEFSLSSEMDANTMLEAQTVDVSKDKPAFQYNLSDVAVTGENAWKNNVDLSKTQYALYEDKDCTPSKEVSGVVGTGKLIDPAVVNANGTSENDPNKAATVKFSIKTDQTGTLKLNTTYYLKTTFYRENGTDVLNTVIQPVMFTAPALKDLFATKEGFVKDDVIIAYFYKGDDGKTPIEKSVDLNKYFDKSVDDVTVELDDETNIATKGTTKYTSDGLATATGSNFKDTKVELKSVMKTDDADEVYELGYGEALIVNVSKGAYVKGNSTWTYTKDAEKVYTFKIRLMSPIMEGSVKAVGDVINLNANDLLNGAKITDAMIKGYDFANNEYNVVPDAINSENDAVAAWADPQIARAEMTRKVSDTYFTKDPEIKPATKDSKDVITNGYFLLTAGQLVNTTETTVTVTVTDIWGYKKPNEVKVKITVGE